MKIYTRTGDKGKTGIHGGQRVEKDDIRIEANGCLDELNSMIGVVRSFLPSEHEYDNILFNIQSDMMVIMSHVATPSQIRDQNPNVLNSNIVSECESIIDSYLTKLEESRFFVLPGGNLISAHLQLARTIARRCERRLWTLTKIDEVPDLILQYINRLSDLLFVMARYEMQSQGEMEEKWQHFMYKPKRASKKEE